MLCQPDTEIGPTPADAPDSAPLFPQPHGFEGLGRVVEPLEADGLSVPNGPHVAVLVLALRTAVCTSRSERSQHDDLVADVLDLTHLDTDTFEGLVHRTQGVLIGGNSAPRP